MTNTKQEHFYFVDPGIGEKNTDCPYSFFKDGHDIESFITPPEGYVLTGFQCEPYPEDKFYDGKIVAQYEKDPESGMLSKNILKYVLSVFIIGLLVVLAYFLYNNFFKTTPTTKPKLRPKSEIKALPPDTMIQNQISDTSSITEDSILEDTTLLGVVFEDNLVIVEKVPQVDKTIEIADQKSEILAQSDNETVQEQESPSDENLTKEQFQQEFWSLIHRKESYMRTYGDLYRKYKKLNLKTREYNYLFSTILENTTAFDIWKEKLFSIPDNELKSVNTINALIQKIEEYE